LPPPDLAGFDDGGGALSFFGACKEMHEEVSATPGSYVQWPLEERVSAPSRLGRRRGDGGAREGSEGEEYAAPALARVWWSEMGRYYTASPSTPLPRQEYFEMKRVHFISSKYTIVDLPQL
jgi:hypothetical protein